MFLPLVQESDLQLLVPLEVEKGGCQLLGEIVVNRGRKRLLEVFLPIKQPFQEPLVLLHRFCGLGDWPPATGTMESWSTTLGGGTGAPIAFPRPFWRMVPPR